jgi:predicted ArsR family transcriptional regulator
MKFPGEAAERVARSLIEQGPANSAALAERLGMSQAGVRRHLRALVDAGLIEASDRPPYGPVPSQGRGRPSAVYVVTGVGRAAASDAYGELAVDAMRFLAATPGAIESFAEARAQAMERTLRHAIDDSADSDVQAVAEALSASGYAASVEVVGDGAAAVQLCQHHCPVVDAAAEFPQLCEAETEALGRVLGRHVTRLATLAHGDGVCTTLIPTTTPAPPQRRKVSA